MSSQVKPYRLINLQELQHFQERFSAVFIAWNQDYACQAINGKIILFSNQDKNDHTELQLLTHNHQPLALVESKYLALMKKNLFDDDANSFNSVSEQLFMTLMSQLLDVDRPQFADDLIIQEHWFYPGSACLCLLLSTPSNVCKLYLHPNWVIYNLPNPHFFEKPLFSLDEALANQSLQYTVQLQPFHLSIEALLALQIGDVIQSDHSISKPCLMQHQQQILAEVKLGQTQHHKSIQL